MFYAHRKSKYLYVKIFGKGALRFKVTENGIEFRGQLGKITSAKLPSLHSLGPGIGYIIFQGHKKGLKEIEELKELEFDNFITDIFEYMQIIPTVEAVEKSKKMLKSLFYGKDDYNNWQQSQETLY